MRYSNYLGQVIRNQGIPHFTQSAVQDYFNVIFIEGEIKAMKLAQSKLEKGDQFKFEMEIFKFQKQLTGITGNQEPKVFLNILMQRRA